MDAREQRGLVIAALCKLNKTEGGWLVPSQQGTAIYTVNPSAQTCTCPDRQEAGFKCKHIFAVEFTIKREVGADGTVTETKSVTLTEKKVYSQNWPAYNAAQATEKKRVQVLLKELCRNLPDRQRAGPRKGPNPHLTRDAVFCMAFKVYCGLSTRRFSTDLLEAHEKGYVTKPIPGMKVATFFEDGYFTPILKGLIGYSARPLRSVESAFAIDSSGFGSCRYERWYDQKYGVTRMRSVWVKVHLACGTKTNVVTAVRILDKGSGDSPQFVPLVKETREHFEIGEVSADKAYASLENFEEVAGMGAVPYIAFKENTTGAVGGWFEKAFHFFQFHQEEYLTHYHQRSNVESTFSAIKRKFGDAVMSKTDTAMKNEVLCKVLCHNLTCLIQEQETLGIAPVFWKDEAESRAACGALPTA
jgi:hypothetical protein